MRSIGIDEAGLGPVLGPLTVCVLSADPQQVRALGADDSKKLHVHGNLQPLAAIAVPLMRASGCALASIADVLRWAGCDPSQRPWLADAEHLPVPGVEAATASISCAIGCACVDAPVINDAQFPSKAAVEIALIAGLLRPFLDPGPARIVVDRLGGRKFYAGVVCEWLGELAEVVEESPACSRYRCAGHDIQFAVGADASDPLVGGASCVAKYVRECWMLAFNHWWSARHPTLRPTAGYPEDAQRWLRDSDTLRDHRHDHLLIRTR